MPKYIATPECSLGQMIDEYLLTQGERLETLYVVPQQLQVCETLFCILKISVLHFVVSACFSYFCAAAFFVAGFSFFFFLPFLLAASSSVPGIWCVSLY